MRDGGSEGELQVCDDIKFLPLGQIEEAIYFRRKQAGLPVFRDLPMFSESLGKLAAEYVERRKCAAQAELEAQASQRRFQNIAHAAAQLQRALEALDHSEIETLGGQQSAAFGRWEAALGGPVHGTTYWFVDGEANEDEVAGARSAVRMLACRDLSWLREGAEALSPAPKRGRQANRIENQIAAKFVYLCHYSGWSPVQFANSGTDTRDADAQISDAVLCLAAVFACAQPRAVHMTKCMTQAYSALKALRTGVEWDVWRKVRDSDGGPYSAYEGVTLEINLKKVRMRRSARPAQSAFRRLARPERCAK